MREWNRRSREVKRGGSGLRLDEAEARRYAEQVITGLAEWIETDIAAGKASLNTRRAYQLDGRQLFEWLVLEQICPDEVGHEEASRYRNLLVDANLYTSIFSPGFRKLPGHEFCCSVCQITFICRYLWVVAVDVNSVSPNGTDINLVCKSDTLEDHG